jgi:hypothetical protein
MQFDQLKRRAFITLLGGANAFGALLEAGTRAKNALASALFRVANRAR